MLLLLLAYLGGVLTILSPCILPVLPFVFARSDQPFRKSGLPLLVGMCLTFAVVASLATVGGGWAVRANQFGRVAALVATACVFGLSHFNKRTTFFNWRYVLLAAIAGIFYGRAWRGDRRVGASAITHATVDTVWGALLR